MFWKIDEKANIPNRALSMHPIIKEFVETPGPLNEIVERLYDKRNLLETVLRKLCRLKNVVLDI